MKQKCPKCTARKIKKQKALYDNLTSRGYEEEYQLKYG